MSRARPQAGEEVARGPRVLLRYARPEDRAEFLALYRANRGSRALARGAGFSREGLSRRMLRIAGRWEDCERWSLLADEWSPRARKTARRVRPERVSPRRRR